MNTEDEDDSVTVTLTISRAAYDKARDMAAEKDPRRSILGEFAGMFTTEEFLGNFLEIRLEETR